MRKSGTSFSHTSKIVQDRLAEGGWTKYLLPSQWISFLAPSYMQSLPLQSEYLSGMVFLKALELSINIASANVAPSRWASKFSTKRRITRANHALKIVQNWGLRQFDNIMVFLAVAHWFRTLGLFLITSRRLPYLEDAGRQYSTDTIGYCPI